jgi:HlyD family secretion protein
LAALAPFRESLSEDQRARFDAELDQVMNARRVTVWVLEGKQPKAVSVRVGVSDSAHTEVLSGLDEGTLVIVGAGS